MPEVTRTSNITSVSPPREIVPGFYWFHELVDTIQLREWLTNHPRGQELSEDWYERGEDLYLSINAFLLDGEDRSLQFDTLSAADSEYIVGELQHILGEDGLDHLVLSHDEPSHSANAGDIVEAFPEVTMLGSTAGANEDFHHLQDAAPFEPGDTVDLGGFTVEAIEPVFMDTAPTIWMFEHETRTVFTVDSFNFPLHTFETATFVDELETPVTVDRFMQYHGRSLPWLEYADPDRIEAEIDHMMETYEPEMIAPPHGPILRGDVDRYVEMVKQAIAKIHDEGSLQSIFSYMTAEP